MRQALGRIPAYERKTAGCAVFCRIPGLIPACGGDKNMESSLNDDAIPARFRLNLTATPRIIDPHGHHDETGEPVAVASMTDPALYGPIHQPIALREAITAAGCPIPTSQSSPSTAPMSMTRAPSSPKTVNLSTSTPRRPSSHWPRTPARTALRNALVFCNRIAASQQWVQCWTALAASSHTPAVMNDSACVHIDGSMPSAERDAALATLHDTSHHMRLASNCRVLSEGVDVPALDAVVFAQPRTSAPDIVQIVGRALRPHPTQHSRQAVIVIPVIIDDNTTSVEVAASRGQYAAAWQVLTAMSLEDTALYRSLARLLADTTGTPTEPGTEDDMVDIDTTALSTAMADAFRLKILRSTTSTWTALGVHLRNHVLSGGTPYPRRGLTRGGYPIGERTVTPPRRAHRRHPAPPHHRVHRRHGPPDGTGHRDPPPRAVTGPTTPTLSPATSKNRCAAHPAVGHHHRPCQRADPDRCMAAQATHHDVERPATVPASRNAWRGLDTRTPLTSTAKFGDVDVSAGAR